MNSACAQLSYVLVTAAFNEEQHIGSTIKSVTAQTRLPLRWVIVSDGSTDQTDAIVKQYAEQYRFICLFRLSKKHTHNFGAQVHAINAGVSELKDMEYNLIGNLDADVVLPPPYFETLIGQFSKNNRLGLAGGFIHDLGRDGQFRNRSLNTTRSVAHAVQLFRRECFQAVKAYVPLPYGGPDTHAEVSARMKGWHVQSFPELEVLHLRPTGTAGGWLRSSFRQGLMDYSLGYHPVYEIAKSFRHFWTRPIPFAVLARMGGFCSGHITGEKRVVSDEFTRFLRYEQTRALAHFFRIARGRRSRGDGQDASRVVV